MKADAAADRFAGLNEAAANAYDSDKTRYFFGRRPAPQMSQPASAATKISHHK